MNPLLPLLITNPELALTLPRCIITLTPAQASHHLGGGGCSICKDTTHE